MTVIGVQDFISATLASQVKPATLSASAVAAQAPVATPAPAAQTAALSTSIPVQSLDTAAFNSASSTVAQYGSVLQVAQSGIGDVSQLLEQLQNLAGQPAAGTVVSTATLTQINSQFQAILQQINKIAQSTTFNGASLLDGTFDSQQLAPASGGQSQQTSATLPDLTTQALFGSEEPNLLTPEAAAQAYSLVGDAKTKVDDAGKDVTASQSQVEFASASLQTALTNIDASTATLSDADLSGAFENLLGGLLSQPSAAAQLQAANVSPNLLSLLGE